MNNYWNAVTLSVCLAGLLASVLVAPAFAAVAPSSSITAVANDYSTWSSGYCTRIQLSNRGESVEQPEELRISLAGDTSIKSGWGGSFKREGETVVVRFADYVKQLQPGASQSKIGYCTRGNSHATLLVVYSEKPQHGQENQQTEQAEQAEQAEQVEEVNPHYLWSEGYENSPWDLNWGLEYKQSARQQITGNGALAGHKSALVTYPAGSYSSAGGVQYKMRFNLLSPAIPATDSLFVRYYVKFGDGIDFKRGGKLPGLIGGDANTGGRKPNGFDGFSARLMWRAGGRVVQYLYHPDQPRGYGEDLSWDVGGNPRYFNPGQWHCVETYLKMNTVSGSKGNYDGVVRSWLDGDMALNRTNIRFRHSEALKIDGLYFSTFFGGGNSSWAPVKDETVMFDEFVIDEQRIGCRDDL